MTSNRTFGRKVVLAVSFLLVVGVFAASVGYRMVNPGLEKHARQKTRGASAMSSAMGGGRIEGIRETMALLKENPEDFESLKKLGNAFLMMQAWDRAEPFLERAQKINPDDHEVLMSLAIVHFQLKDHQAAASIYEKLLQESPDDPLINYNLGILYKHFLNKPTEAAALFRKSVENAGDDAEMQERARQELQAMEQ